MLGLTKGENITRNGKFSYLVIERLDSSLDREKYPRVRWETEDDLASTNKSKMLTLKPKAIGTDPMGEMSFANQGDKSKMFPEYLTPNSEFSQTSIYLGSYFYPRILSPAIKKTGHVILDLCNNQGQHEQRTVMQIEKTEGGLYKQARKARWGDLWPYE